MTREEAEAKVFEFVRRHEEYSLRLDVDTHLAEDIGIAGDDAVEFFDDFSKEFSVNCKAFNVYRHFGGEAIVGCVPTTGVTGAIFLLGFAAHADLKVLFLVLLVLQFLMLGGLELYWRRRQASTPPVVVGHLVQAVLTGSLSDSALSISPENRGSTARPDLP